MGSRKRPRALRLHEKLRQIREAYGLSQAEMVSRLGLLDELKQSDVSAFEREPDDKWSREPALPHLLRYARVAGVNVELLIDDEQDLPDKLAPDPMHGVVRHTSKVKTARRAKKR
ncbi:MAG: Helix-turn-helix domain [Acidobacteriota bacterium]|jgi:transcriptional regulator with XRE-family HTH domain|nr:Helix-turn-helix domain [Acidobacteriota bacterium]